MKKRLLFAFILLAYVAILIRVMVFKDMPVIRIGPLMLNFGGTHDGPANLVPFKTILPYLLGENGLMIAFINIVGNIVLLVPIGFLFPFVFPGMTAKKTIVLAVASGLSIELMQAVLHVGIFDIDDVLLNGLGVMIGYWSYKMLMNLLRSGKYKTIIITTLIGIAAAVVAFYTFFPNGHPSRNSGPGIEGPRLHSNDGVDSGQLQHDSIINGETESNQQDDPCNGTGGTGEIVSAGNHTITIKGHNGINKLIKLTDDTKISSGAGVAHESDLKPGVRVTVVIDGNMTASVVLLCNGSKAMVK